jgi:6-phosphogluconolactonase
VLHQGNFTTEGSSVTGYAVGTDGKLTALPGSTQQLLGGIGAPAQVQFSPDGTKLVVTERTNDIIDVLPIDQNGIAGAPISNSPSGSGPFGFRFAGQDLLIVSELNTASTSSYRLGQDGKLTVVSGAVSNEEQGACWVAVPNGTVTPRFAYVSNAVSGSISGFNIDNAGALSLLNADGHSAVTVDSHAALDSAVSDDGKFLYIVTAGFDEQAEPATIDPSSPMSINAFRVEADGKLTAIHGPGGPVPAIEGLAPGTQGIAAT